MTVSVRSYLAAGLAAVSVSAMVAVPAARPGGDALQLPSIELSAAVSPLAQPATAAAGALLGVATTESVAPAPAPASAPASSTASSPRPAAAASLPPFPVPIPVPAAGSAGEAIINAYNAIEPWAQWVFEVAAWAAGWLVGWLAQQINIAYDTGEPIVAALVYSFAFAIDGQFTLIGPTLVNGVQTAVTNLVRGEVAWVLSIFPPLPPGPVLQTAAAASRTAVPPAAARIRPAAAVSDSIATTPDATEAQLDAAPTTIEAPRNRRGVSRGSSTRAHQAKPDVAPQSTAAAANIAPPTAIAAEAAAAPAAAAVTEPRKASRTSVRAARSGSREG